MSSRSAYGRKKATEAKQKKTGGNNSRPPSTTSSSHDDHIPDFPLPPGPAGPSITSPRYPNQMPQIAEPFIGGRRGWPQGGQMMVPDPRRDAYTSNQLVSPTEDWIYGRQRRPTLPGLRTEEVSGIEKSGLRNMLDKQSDSVRKGLAKTFAFRKKDKEDEVGRRGSVDRPESAATTRAGNVPRHDEDHGYDKYVSVPVPTAPTPTPYSYPQPQLPSPPSPNDPWSVSPIGPPPQSKLPPIPKTPPASAPQIKRWLGGGRPVGKWNKLRKDPELWDPNGDVLVFLGRRGARQPPSFRLSSHIIEATESRHLITLLREGSTEEDMYLPPSPAGGPYGTHLGQGLRGGPITPPVSEDASIGDMEGQISYEMYLTPPQNMSRNDQLRHQITTRNVFALLYHASLVGLSLHQALSDLHIRLDSYMPPQNDNVSQIVRYMSTRGLDDVRSDPATAVSLLAWAEGPDVRWEDGWRECFAHCAGMYTRVEACKDFKHVTPITRALLERASLEMQVRVQAAEERLCGFEFDDMWALGEEDGPARNAAERLREMFQGHYERVYGSWPPTQSGQALSQSLPSESSGGGEPWLKRTVVMALQKDFGALYDYLVDRDIVWDVSEARSGRKWMMASESGNMGFEADTDEVPMTDMLIEFDNKQRIPHIPHPYPLLPESIPPFAAPAPKDAGGLFRSGRKTEGGPTHRRSAMERRVQLAYTESTNIYALGSDFAASDLVDAFVRFEKSDRVGEVDPATARMGRWVLIYGVLQTLASVSVDDERVRHVEAVEYHLSPRLKGTRVPPWKKGRSEGVGGGAHERSFCWVAGERWERGGSEDEEDASPVLGPGRRETAWEEDMRQHRYR
ncbi:hypothetical protein ACJ41O_007121 [Fusarium nematophilum]